MPAEQWTWITAGGSSYRLDSNVDGAQIVESVTGRGMPPIRRLSEIVPLRAGSRRRSTVHDEGEVTVGVYFAGDTDVALRSNVRAWIRRFDPTLGDGKLQVTGPAGDTRELTCSYQDGLDLEEPAGMREDQLAVLTLVASDPYWADADPTVVQWQTDTPNRAFFPILPLHLGSSQVFARTEIDPLGDVASYPVWTISGPGSDITLQNLTTGRTLAWNGTLGFGEQLTIDTRPGNQTLAPKSVVLQDGSNQFGLLTAWDFWPLIPGTNDISIEMTGATEDSIVTGSWQARYLSA